MTFRNENDENDDVPMFFEVHRYINTCMDLRTSLCYRLSSSFFNQVSLDRIFSSCDDVATRLQKKLFSATQLPYGIETVSARSVLKTIHTNPKLDFEDRLLGLVFVAKQLKVAIPYNDTLYILITAAREKQALSDFDGRYYVLLADALASEIFIQETDLRQIFWLVMQSLIHTVEHQHVEWQVVATILETLIIKRNLSLDASDYDRLLTNGLLHPDVTIRAVMEKILRVNILKDKTVDLKTLLQEPALLDNQLLLLSIMHTLTQKELLSVHQQYVNCVGLKKSLANVVFAVTMAKITKKYLLDEHTIEFCCLPVLNGSALNEKFDSVSLIFLQHMKHLIEQNDEKGTNALFLWFLKLFKNDLYSKQWLKMCKIIVHNHPELIRKHFTSIVKALFIGSTVYIKSSDFKLQAEVLTLLLQHAESINFSEASPIYIMITRIWFRRVQQAHEWLHLLGKKMSPACHEAFTKEYVLAVRTETNTLTNLASVQPNNPILQKELELALADLDHEDKDVTKFAWQTIVKLARLLSAAEQERLLLKLLAELKQEHADEDVYDEFACDLASSYITEFGITPGLLQTLQTFYLQARGNEARYYGGLYRQLLLSMPYAYLSSPRALVDFLAVMHQYIEKSWHNLPEQMQRHRAQFYLALAPTCQHEWLRTEIEFMQQKIGGKTADRIRLIFKVKDAIMASPALQDQDQAQLQAPNEMGLAGRNICENT